ncbi:MAG: hypothetical protein J7L61_02750 [Thermoplasmata archaeon]|nr:hypothetical protein [Thermoplasmata archaeon]
MTSFSHEAVLSFSLDEGTARAAAAALAPEEEDKAVRVRVSLREKPPGAVLEIRVAAEGVGGLQAAINSYIRLVHTAVETAGVVSERSAGQDRGDV